MVFSPQGINAGYHFPGLLGTLKSASKTIHVTTAFVSKWFFVILSS